MIKVHIICNNEEGSPLGLTMLLSFDILPWVIFRIAAFIPLVWSAQRGWGFMSIAALFFAVIRLVPNNTAFFSLAPLARIISIALWFTSIAGHLDIRQAYYLPSRVPYPLIPLLYLLEVISDVVRPLALTVRIVVNLSLRHLFVHGAARPMYGVVLILILAFELAVARVQSYIYCTLPALW